MYTFRDKITAILFGKIEGGGGGSCIFQNSRGVKITQIAMKTKFGDWHIAE